MKRKLIQHGLSSLTISLPHAWVKGKNVKKGDEIDVEEVYGRLVISAQSRPEHKRISVDITNAKPMIRRMIGVTYKTGYDEVHIKFGTHEELKAVFELVREQFTGFSIASQTKDSITIHNLSQMNLEEFDAACKRFFFVLNNMASEVRDALSKNDINWLKNTALMKIESDKLADFCRRAINLGYAKENVRIGPLYTVIEQLEKVVDRYKDLCEHVATSKITVDKQVIHFLDKLIAFQKQFYQLFYQFDMNEIVAFGRTKEQLQKELDSLIVGAKKNEIKTIILLDRILNIIFDLNGPLMAVRIK